MVIRLNSAIILRQVDAIRVQVAYSPMTKVISISKSIMSWLITMEEVVVEATSVPSCYLELSTFHLNLRLSFAFTLKEVGVTKALAALTLMERLKLKLKSLRSPVETLRRKALVNSV